MARIAWNNAPWKKIQSWDQHTELIQTAEVCIPLRGCTSLIRAGEDVRLGQRIGEPEAEDACAVHASVSGTVRFVGIRPWPNGQEGLTVSISSDGQEIPASRQVAGDPWQLSADEVLKRLREHGVACWYKIREALPFMDTLLVCCCEVSPGTDSQVRTAVEQGERLARGIRLIRHLRPDCQLILAVEPQVPHFSQSLRRVLGNEKARIEKLRLPWPRDPMALIPAMTGRRGGSPEECGVLLLRPQELVDIAAAIFEGRPVVRHTVSVNGSAVAMRRTFTAPIGTPVHALARACGGLQLPVHRMVAGGILDGSGLFDPHTGIDDSVDTVLLLAREDDDRLRDPQCVECGRCTDACPVGLDPRMLYAYSMQGDHESCRALHLDRCTGCGACAYVCTGALPLRQQLLLEKAELYGKESEMSEKNHG